MKVRLAFVAISVAALSVVACQPQDGPSPSRTSVVVDCNSPGMWATEEGVRACSMPELCRDESDRGPCVWLAGRQGNGKGASFEIMPDGSVRYLSPADLEVIAETLG